jgi:hypothetical protein
MYDFDLLNLVLDLCVSKSVTHPVFYLYQRHFYMLFMVCDITSFNTIRASSSKIYRIERSNFTVVANDTTAPIGIPITGTAKPTADCTTSEQIKTLDAMTPFCGTSKGKRF